MVDLETDAEEKDQSHCSWAGRKVVVVIVDLSENAVELRFVA